MSDWIPVEPHVESATSRFEFPLEELAAGNIPALVVRNAWSKENCQNLIARLVEEELLYDPSESIPPKLQEKLIPEGYSGKEKAPCPHTPGRSRRLQAGILVCLVKFKET